MGHRNLLRYRHDSHQDVDIAVLPTAQERDALKTIPFGREHIHGVRGGLRNRVLLRPDAQLSPHLRLLESGQAEPYLQRRSIELHWRRQQSGGKHWHQCALGPRCCSCTDLSFLDIASDQEGEVRSRCGIRIRISHLRHWHPEAILHLQGLLPDL